MKQSNYPHGFRSSLFRNALLALLLWTTAVIGSWWWSNDTYQQHIVDLAKKEADTNINKDWSFRLWATSHGGVYVPPDENTPPNPYLAHIPDRDIVTDKGKRLTLMNPAYMLRQIMEHYSALFGVKGHITSLVLTNPNNAPDEWETESLKSFQRGLKEAVIVTTLDGKPYLRLMRPMLMEKGCMKCHAKTGIKVGEIRGGISTAVPLEPLYLASKSEIDNNSLIHGIVWLLGVGAIAFVSWRNSLEGANRRLAEEKIEQLQSYQELIVDSMGEGLLTLDAEGNHVLVNPAAARMLGYSAEELIGRQSHSIWHHTSMDGTVYPENECPIYNTLQEGKVHRLEDDMFWRKDGTGFPVEYISTPIRDGNEISGAVVMFMDITRRRQALETLSESEHFLKQLLANLPVAVVVHGPDSVIRYGNPAAQEILGLTEDQLRGRSAYDPGWHFIREDGSTMPPEEYPASRVISGKKPLHGYVIGVVRQPGDKPNWINISAFPDIDPQGQLRQAIVSFMDVTERKRAEAAGRELAAIVESSDDAIIGESLEGIITSWNKGAERIYGYMPEEAIGKPVTALAPAERHAEIGVMLEKVRSGEGMVHYETVRLRKDGRQISVSLTLSPIRNAAGVVVGISTIGRDITERKAAEEELHRAYAYNRSLIEASLDPLVTISPDGKITDVNAATEAVTGYSREALIGNEFLNYFTEPDKARAGYQQVFREGMVQDYALEIRHRDGHVTPVLYNASLYSDEEGKVIGVFAAARDISVRKRALEALQQSEAQLKEAQRIAHLGNWNLDLTDNALAWSDEIFRIFEIDPHEFGATYEAFLNTIHPDDRERVNSAYTESVKNKTPYDISHRLLMKDGRIKYVNERCETYYAADGKPLRSVGTVHDITESKLAEEEIRKLNQELEQRVAERTAQLEAANKELEAFAYSVSHDLRTPLRAIDGFSRILLDDYPDKLDEEGKRYLHIVRDNTMRMGQLIDDILSFSRMGRRELAAQPLNLNKLTQEVFDELRPGAADRVLKLELKPLPPVQGDQAMLRQVLVNLLSNAIKFTRPRPEGIIEVGAMPGGKEIVFYVRDNGVGFDMQYAGKLFGVFQRLHAGEEFEGTGIGLANVKRIIARHGGRVWAEGKVNEGATIYFTLPQGESA